MTIGGSIALIVLGAILAFAVEFEIAGVNIDAVGYILMIGGLVGLIFGLIWWQRRPAGPAVEERRTVTRDY
jgi:hypothetical protein